MVAYEWALRALIGWLIEHRRQPNVALRYLNAFIETSIPTVMLFIAVSLMGPRDAFGSPAFLLYFFFILLSILRLDARLCLFTGLVAAVEHFIFAYVVIGAWEPVAQGRLRVRRFTILFARSSCSWPAWLPVWWLDKSSAKLKPRCARCRNAIGRCEFLENTSRRKSLISYCTSRSSSAVNCATSA